MTTIGPGEPRAAVALRPYQEGAIAAAGKMLAQKRTDGKDARALIVLPTGCGKTQTAITLLERALTKRPAARVLWIAHRKELLDQPIRAMARVESTRWVAGLCGVVQGQRSQPDRQIVMGSVQTLEAGNCRRLKGILQYGVPDIVVIDEAHHSTSGQYQRVIKEIEAACAEAEAKPPAWIGLTATPERTDGVGLASLWGTEAAFTYGISDAIADGYLCPPRFIDEQMKISEDIKAKIKALEDAGRDEDVGDLLIEAGIVPATVEAMGRHLSRGVQTGAPVPSIVFCAGKKQAEKTVAALLGAGWRAGLIFGNTGANDRVRLLFDFERDNLDVIVNVAVLTEGTDLPRCGGIVAARPFSSKPLWLQSVGRGLRLYPGKAECLVVDLAGAHKEHHGILGVALIGDEAGDQDGEAQRAGITYTINGDGITIYGQAYEAQVPGEDGPQPVYVRALPVVRGKARGVVPVGVDRGLRLVPVAIGVKVPDPDGGPAKIKWTKIAEADPGQPVDALGCDIDDLPLSGRELERVTNAGNRVDLTRERKPLSVAWVVANIAGHDVRVVELGHDLPGRKVRAPVALWVIEDGHADGEPGYRVVERHQAKTRAAWYGPGTPGFSEAVRQITSAPVPWSSAEALCSDYVRQAARTAGADEPWRKEPSDPRKVHQVINGFRVDPAMAWAARTAGDLYDLIARLRAEHDPLGRALIEGILGGVL